jgi:hypothetical protein
MIQCDCTMKHSVSKSISSKIMANSLSDECCRPCVCDKRDPLIARANLIRADFIESRQLV